MAVNEAYIAPSPDKVFDVLSDAESYGYWVVGSKEIREVEAGWPGSGTRFGIRWDSGPSRSRTTPSARARSGRG